MVGSLELNGEEIVGSFYEKELQKTNQQDFMTKKLMKKKIHIKWKGHDNLLIISWIDKEDIII